MGFARAFLTTTFGLALATVCAAETATLRVATQVSGTVNWELSTITAQRLDQANGFTLQVQDVAAGPAAQIAFQAGEADVIVSDWLWVARMRTEGQDYVFIPYSKAVGALMVRAESAATALGDLKGTKIGIAGGPIDKSWLILRAYAQTQGFDLAAETEQVFGAPPLIYETAKNGETDGMINFWHFNAKAQASGFRPLVTVSEAARALGLSAETPLLGYVVKGAFVREHPDLVHGFATASRAAKTILAQDDSAWDSLRPIMNAATDAEFDALIQGFRAGIPADQEVDVASADKLLKIMAELGGTDLLGNTDSLPDGVFLEQDR